jgi:hypothetical protein
VFLFAVRQPRLHTPQTAMDEKPVFVADVIRAFRIRYFRCLHISLYIDVGYAVV